MLILTVGLWSVVSWTSRMLYASGYPGYPAAYLQLVSHHQFLAALTWSLWILADFLLIGDHEVIYNPQRAIQRATRLVPGLKTEIVPNANHNAQVTAPEIVNEKILEFLATEPQNG